MNLARLLADLSHYGANGEASRSLVDDRQFDFLRERGKDGLRLERGAFAGASWTGAWLSRALLLDVDLRGGDLTDAVLAEATLIGVDLTGARLCGADLSDAGLWGVRLQGADLTDALLLGAELVGTDLRGACLCGADLTDALLHGTDLTDAVYDGCTSWPDGFNPGRHGVRLQSVECPGISSRQK